MPFPTIWYGERPPHPGERNRQSGRAAGTVPDRRDLADEAFRQMRALYNRCQDVRRAGCASPDLCYVADGRVTVPNGAPLSLTEGGAMLVSSQILHAPLMNALNG